MIRKITTLFTALLICITLAACGSAAPASAPSTAEGDKSSVIESATESITESTSESKSENTDKQTDTASVVSEADQSEPESNGTNILVVYFSRTGEQYGVGVIDEGNTAIVAKMIAEQTGADTFEILPTDDHYPMTYDALTDVAKQEQNENARPEYQGGVPELSKYDTIFIGAPVWWGDWPMIMYTFFENENLSGKTLIPFSTHAGSGLSGFDRKLSDACPDSTVLDGLAVAGTDTQNDRNKVKNEVTSWLSGLGYY